MIVDTNVLFAGLYSPDGDSGKLLRLIGQGHFTLQISNPLLFEYEKILKDHRKELGLSLLEIDKFLDYIKLVSVPHKIFFLWRPFLKDKYDDMILELSFKSNSQYIITFNVKDFSNMKSVFKCQTIKPGDFLDIIGV
ncbi:MAG TPA: putative toxin-antitoxin system toxin component, PIN family [Leptospiraceae bacterium]|nr:putative toxin-antitoxin system toxin component, PIN family [Leptospiraceae bacterium]HRG73997.1 putative toxin-antitoxin system toxin component, PIN family [Leptospiraceae bacterium]